MIVRWDDKDSIFVAQIPELPGCSAHGDSPAEALDMLRDNQTSWIEAALEAGEQIPIPRPEEDLPSGKWLQRVPRSLHKKVIECAEEEGVSLNTFVTYCLSRAVGSSAAVSNMPRGRGVVNALLGSSYSRLHEQLPPMYGGNISLMSSGHGKSHSFFNYVGPEEEIKGYSLVLNTLANQLPDHYTNKRERKSRGEKENYQVRAYA